MDPDIEEICGALYPWADYGYDYNGTCQLVNGHSGNHEICIYWEYDDTPDASETISN